jgi:hypothetical protein
MIPVYRHAYVMMLNSLDSIQKESMAADGQGRNDRSMSADRCRKGDKLRKPDEKLIWINASL